MKFFKEPLFLFLLIGVALFGLNALVNDGDKDEVGGNVIRIEKGEIALLSETFKKQRSRPPTGPEAQNLLDGFIREQVFYREAMALGLDKDDSVVRRRMVQKMEFLFGDIGTMVEPTEDELEQFYSENSGKYSVSGNISFVHVYLSLDKHGENLESEINKVKEKLVETTPAESAILELGDSLMLPFQIEDTALEQVGRMFGSEFAEQLKILEVGKWSGPVQSGFGLHFIYISNRSEKEILPLNVVVSDVKTDFDYARRQKIKIEVFEKLKDRYEIVVAQEEQNQ